MFAFRELTDHEKEIVSGGNSTNDPVYHTVYGPDYFFNTGTPGAAPGDSGGEDRYQPSSYRWDSVLGMWVAA